MKGKIDRKHRDGTYNVEYDDGDVEKYVEAENLRSVGGSGGGGGGDRLREGDKVEANYRGKGKFYKGKISRDRGDGTFDIDYDDGEKESRVEKDMIKSLESGS